MEGRDYFGERVFTVATGGTYGVVGGVAGLGAGEIAVLPAFFPDETAEHRELNDRIYDTRTQLDKDEAALQQAQNAHSEGVDYSGLERKISAEQTELHTLQETHLPYDDVQSEVLTIGAAAGLVLGALVGVVRARLKIRKQRREDALAVAPTPQA